MLVYDPPITEEQAEGKDGRGGVYKEQLNHHSFVSHCYRQLCIKCRLFLQYKNVISYFIGSAERFHIIHHQ